MHRQFSDRLNHWLEGIFPDRRLFLRSDDETRFIRLKPTTQFAAVFGCTVVVAWSIIATSILLMDSIGAGNFRAQAQRDQQTYEERLNAIAVERDMRASEARSAQDRFNAALQQISIMQSELLEAEDQLFELERGIEVIQANLRRTLGERNTARDELATTIALADGAVAGPAASGAGGDGAVDFLSAALAATAAERDQIAADAEDALIKRAELELEIELMEERNAVIFQQLEEAMLVSVEPLDDMFRAAGMNPDNLLAAVRRGYSGQGGPLTPLQFSTRGGTTHPDAERANSILSRLDSINLYRIAAERAPFAMPVQSDFRFTSGFGPRWGRMHNGTDFAAGHGTPIYSTADGVIIHAGWSSGYGRLVKIQHEFGIETRYAHLAQIRVQVGQRVSRGERIGDMGSSGRSTGTHLHYEIRVNGQPVNPMIYIRAGRDVF